jgi:hypothetical protein
MDSTEQPQRVGSEVGWILGEMVREDFRRSGISLLGLSVAANIPRTTLRTKMAHGDFTVAELYRIAPHVGANVLTWTAQLETRLKDSRTPEKVSA